MARRRIPGLLDVDGVLAVGPGGARFEVPEPARWRSKRFRRPAPHRRDIELETVVLIQRDDGEAWHPVVGGFKEVPAT